MQTQEKNGKSDSNLIRFVAAVLAAPIMCTEYFAPCDLKICENNSAANTKTYKRLIVWSLPINLAGVSGNGNMYLQGGGQIKKYNKS